MGIWHSPCVGGAEGKGRECFVKESGQEVVVGGRGGGKELRTPGQPAEGPLDNCQQQSVPFHFDHDFMRKIQKSILESLV